MSIPIEQIPCRRRLCTLSSIAPVVTLAMAVSAAATENDACRWLSVWASGSMHVEDEDRSDDLVIAKDRVSH